MDASDGPDLQMDFTDGSSFTVRLRVNATIEAKSIRNDGGQPVVLKDYTVLAIPPFKTPRLLTDSSQADYLTGTGSVREPRSMHQPIRIEDGFVRTCHIFSMNVRPNSGKQYRLSKIVQTAATNYYGY